jgi:hypothetical protein
MTARATTSRRPLAFRYRASILMIDASQITFSPGDWSGRGRKITWPRDAVNRARTDPITDKPGQSRFILEMNDGSHVVVIGRGITREIETFAQEVNVALGKAAPSPPQPAEKVSRATPRKSKVVIQREADRTIIAYPPRPDAYAGALLAVLFTAGIAVFGGCMVVRAAGIAMRSSSIFTWAVVIPPVMMILIAPIIGFAIAGQKLRTANARTQFEITPSQLILRYIYSHRERRREWLRACVRDAIVHLTGVDRGGKGHFELHLHIEGQPIIQLLEDVPEEELDEIAQALRDALGLPSRAKIAADVLAAKSIDHPVRIDDDCQLQYEPAPSEALVDQTPGLVRVFVPQLTWPAILLHPAALIACAVVFFFALQVFVVPYPRISYFMLIPLLIGLGFGVLSCIHLRYQRTMLQIDVNGLTRSLRSPFQNKIEHWSASQIHEVLINAKTTVAIRLSGATVKTLAHLGTAADAKTIANRIRVALGHAPVD